MWVTSDSLGEKEAIESMKKAVPDFEQYCERGQIEIIPHSKWYLKDGTFNLQRVLNAWTDKLNQALAAGYDGMRVTGNTAWLEEKDWRNYTNYEEKINDIINGYRLLAICTYSLERCGAYKAIDVVKNHQSALIRHKGKWELIESSELKQKREAVSETNAQLQMLQQTMSAIHSTLDLEIVFKQITDAVVDSMGYTTAFIVEFNKEKKRFEIKSVAARKRLLSQIDKILGFPLKNLVVPADRQTNPVIQSVMGGRVEIAKTLTEVLYPLVNKRACQAVQKLSGTKNYIVLPLKIGEELVGVMFISSPREAVPEEELRIIQNFAAAAAQSIRNAELYTQSMQAKEALRQSESKFKNLFEHAKDAIFLADAQTGILIDANSAACNLLGLPKEKIVGMQQSEIHPPELAKQYAQIFRDHAEKRISVTEDVIAQRADGSRVPVDISASFIELAGKNIIQGVFHDITGRKQAQKEIQKKTEDLTLVNLLNDSINRGDSLQEVIQLLSKETKKIFPSFGATVYLLSEDKQYLIVQNLNLPPRIIGAIEKLIGIKIPQLRVRLNEGSLHSEVLKTSTAQLINDTETIQRYMAEFTDDNRIKKLVPRIRRITGICSMMSAQLISHGRVIGLLEISSKEPFKKSDLRRFVTIAQQVTSIIERKRAEEALQESQNFSSSLLDNAPHGVVVINPDTSVRYVNPAWVELNGWTLSEVVGMKAPYPWWLEEQKEYMHTGFLEAMKMGSGKGEVLSQKKNGERYWLEMNWTSVMDNGELKYLLVNSTDITEHKQAEEALLAEQQNFRNSIDNSPLGIMILDINSQIRYTNQAYIDMCGYSSADELIATPIEKRFTPESLEKFNERRELRRMGKPVPPSYEVDIIRKDGEIRNITVFHREVIWNGEKQFQTLWQDVTERKKAQERLIVTDRLASVGELAAGVAHELNNPLTSVIGFSQLLLSKDIPDVVKEDIKIICSEAQRTAAIVKNLLTFARKHTPVKQLTNINSTIEQVIQMRAYEQRVNNIRVITHFAPELPEVMADQFQLQQVFLNIIINAEHFMIEANQGGTLTIATKKVGDIIKTSFADDGPGISNENLGHIFNPFFTTKEVGKGTGLGLSICHGIITEHGGRIYAESKLGKGATFTAELPVMNTHRDGVEV